MRENLRYLLGLLGDFLSIGLAVGGSVLVGLLTGWFLDEKVFHGRFAPWLTIIFAAFGIAGGIKNIFYMSKRRLRARKDEKRNASK